MMVLRLPGNKVLSINNSAAIFQHKLNSQQASNLWYDAINTYCQAQFKFSTSSVQFELRLALSLIITTQPPPPPTRESKDAA